MSNDQPDKPKNKVVIKLLGLVFGMFCFGFLLVPIYDVICDVTGLNGKTGGRYEITETLTVDEDRWITLQFTTSNNAGMPWEFQPSVSSMKIRPGEVTETFFVASNPTDNLMTAQAVPSVAPYDGAQYLHKTECFCFNKQTLKPGETINMPLRFFIDKDIPEDVTKLTLSYTLFDLPKVASN